MNDPTMGTQEMNLRPFRLERYFARHEFTARYLLCSSDCETVSISDLLDLEPGAPEGLLDDQATPVGEPGTGQPARDIVEQIGGHGEEGHRTAGTVEGGGKTIADYQEKARFVRISGAGLRESHAHDVTITRESPNYRMM